MVVSREVQAKEAGSFRTVFTRLSRLGMFMCRNSICGRRTRYSD